MRPIKNNKFTDLDIGDLCRNTWGTQIFKVIGYESCSSACRGCISQYLVYIMVRFNKRAGRQQFRKCPGLQGTSAEWKLYKPEQSLGDNI